MIKIIQVIVLIFVFTGCAVTEQNMSQTTKVKSKSYNTEKSEKINQVESPLINDAVVQNNITESIMVQSKEDKKEILNKIAMVFPSSSIGKYALEAVNSVNTYLLYKKAPFDLIVYDMYVQNKKNINIAFDKVKANNITKAIVMITKENIQDLNTIEDIEDIQLYLPLINKNDVKDMSIIENLNIVFGAINYKHQFEKLIQYTNNAPLAEFYDNTAIGYTLHNYLKDKKIRYQKRIDDNNGRYKRYLENNRKLTKAAVIINTPIVKSSILLSAISGSEDIYISKIVSTQLNYTPLLFLLTQKMDRKKLVVANSIGKLPKDLEEYNMLIGNNILYSWVNYSTIVGVEYLVNNNINLFDDLSIQDNQVIYPVKLYKVGDNSFTLLENY